MPLDRPTANLAARALYPIVVLLLLALMPGPCRADPPIQWTRKTAGAQKTYTVGGLRLTITDTEDAAGNGPRLQATAANGAAITTYGTVRGFDTLVELRAARLDPAHSAIDVMFGVFSGGAHCCEEIKVLSLIAGAWKITDLGQWDGYGDQMPTPRPYDNGKTVVLAFPDNAFFYAFDSFAGSLTPLKILQIDNGAVVDVSARPMFAALDRENMAIDKKYCDEGGNGGCAAYVASAARVGEFAPAWQYMLAHYDKTSDWKLVFCDVPGDGDGKCAKNIAFKSYPQALKWFLHRHGYLPARQAK